jgi:hypothetical protein
LRPLLQKRGLLSPTSYKTRHEYARKYIDPLNLSP